MLKLKIPKALKTVGFISVAIMFSKVLGLARQMVFAQIYGAGGAFSTDAFFTASRIPLLFFDFTLGTAVTSAFIPIFVRFKKESKERALKFVAAFFNWVLLISGAITLVSWVAAPFIVKIFAPGMTASTAQFTAKLLIIMLPTMIFTAVAYVLAGFLQSMDEFNIPAIISVVSNGFVIIYLVFFAKKLGLVGMAFAILIGWGLQILVQVPSAIKHGFSLKFRLKDEGMLQAAQLAMPILIASWVQPIAVSINTHFASYLGEGAISVLEYANQLYVMAVSVFSLAITNYILPKLSTGENFDVIMRQSLKSICIIVAPIMLVCIIFARPIIWVLFERGNFNAETAQQTANALRFYSFGMLALGINEILNKSFYARKDALTPMFASLIGIAINILGTMCLRHFGLLSVSTIAISQAVSLNLIMVILLIAQNKAQR